jgi:large subunit ribosomal protein L10
MPKPEKIQKLEEIKETLNNSEGVVLADFKGMSVAELEELRKKVEKEGGSARIVKNKLLKLAFESQKIAGMDGYLKNNTILFLSKSDMLNTLKAVVDYSKKNEKFLLKAGYLDGIAFDKQGVIAMSSMPTRKELLSMIAGGLNSVLSNFVGSLNGVLTTFVGTVEALEKKKGEN